MEQGKRTRVLASLHQACGSVYLQPTFGRW
jgi:hypothetical protein